MKKLISLFLTLIMIISSVGVAYASEQEDKKVLEDTKQLLDIGDYEKFDYSISNEDGKMFYSFNWNDKENGGLNVYSDADLNIYSYSKYNDVTSDKNITEQQAKQLADDFLKKVSKEYSYYKLNENLTECNDAKRITFVYEPFINNHKVLYCNAEISVDLELGEVMNYSAQLPKYVLNIQPDSNAIGIDRAKAKLLADENLKLEYSGFYGEDKPSYKPVFNLDKYSVDAFTGEYLDDEPTAGFAKETANYMESDAAGTDRGLSEVEQKEITNLNQKLSVDNTIQTVEQKFNIKVKHKDDIAFHYYKTDKYLLNLSVENADDDYHFSCTIDEDGVICGLYVRDNILSGEQNIKNYAKSILPETDIPDNIKQSSMGYSEDSEYYNSYFYNKRNGILDRATYLSITYDKNYNVDSISYNYCTDEYMNLEQKLTKDEIWNIINDVLPLDMYYKPTENKLRLCYGFEVEGFKVDAIDKKVLDRWNQEYKKDNGYIDISGKWYEKIAQVLKKQGYDFEGNEFKGEQNVTGRDVCEFMLSEQPEEYAKHSWNGDMYAEFAKNPDKEVTRYDMAKLMAKRKVDEVLLEKGRFERPFNDVTDDNINYVAVCVAYDIVKSDKDTFNGDSTITRAEMAAMQYYCIF